MLQLTLKPRRARGARRAHPWVFRDDVLRLPRELPDGAEADVVDAAGGYVGRGLVSAKSAIVCRIYSDRREALDRGFFRRRILAAAELRTSLGLPCAETDGFRLVFAEGDFLPGLMVDRYGDYLVVQMTSSALEIRKAMLVDLLDEQFHPQGILERNDAPVRQAEGLPLVSGWLAGKPAEGLVVREQGLLFEVDPLGAMKTGHFFDQRENRRLLAPVCRGADVLDMFCYTGGFGLTATKAGATRVLSVDSSSSALAMARRNAELNGVAGQMEFQEGDGFDVLRELADSGRTFDVIVLDPPAFAKRKEHLKSAERGYKQINLRALTMLRPGGYLLTCSCSYTVGREDFRRLVAEAAADAGRALRLAAEGRAGPDHPVLLHVPQTDYLKAVLLQAVEH
jgi:23S rRNA (cytosine1962-C5)-methyltransferase